MHPLLVTKVLYPLHERLKRTPTYAWLRKLETSQWLPPDALRELQFARLREHLQFAYDHAPYYRRLLDEHDLPPQRIRSLEDFRLVPVLTRDILRQRFAGLRSVGVRLGRVQRASTGGSTGQPVTVLIDMSVGFALAARHRAHRWFGLEPGAREIVLWGSPIELTQQDRLRSVRDWLINSKLLSAFDLGADALARYAAILTRHRPQRIYGYASAIYLFACYLKSIGWRPPWRLNAVFTTAEPLFPFQRETIETLFECPVAVEYGSRDAGLLANECPSGGIHIPAEGVLIEIDGAAGDGLGEIVVTNLYTPAMPIIRYRTGDIGELASGSCACGRSLPVLRRIEGRRTDFLVTPSGRILHALSVIYVLREHDGVQDFQVRQESLDRVRVDLVPGPGFSASDRAALQAKIGVALGNEVDVTVETTARIPLSPSGKFRHVVSDVAEAYLDRLLRAHPVGPRREGPSS